MMMPNKRKLLYLLLWKENLMDIGQKKDVLKKL